MTDISVIILTKNEKLHIRRCLERLAPLEPRQIFVVDSFSTDGTQEIVDGWVSGGVGELESGNIDANLTELTFAASSKRNRKLPRLMPLTEAVETVVHRQVAAGSNPSAESSITNNSAKGKGANGIALVEHEWPGLYAKQFNWALDNLPIDAKWVLRMDADEYLTPETIARLREELPKMPEDVTGLSLELKRRFMGGEIRHGTNGIRLLRIFRRGIGRCEERAMDEHIRVSEGKCVDFDGAFYDDNLNSFEWWQEKHRGYAKREAMDAVSLFNDSERLENPSATDRKKLKYYKMPRYFRAFAYFCVRYFLKLGFLDGVAGFRWHFWQGLWYRWLVDREIGRLFQQAEPLTAAKAF